MLPLQLYFILKNFFQTFRFLISPYFLIKWYILRDIQWVVKKYAFDGKILDVGCGQKPYRNIFRNCREYIGIDFKHFSVNKEFEFRKPDIYFSGDYLTTHKLPFKDETYDHAVSFQVLEHHKKPDVMISEIFRVVKKGGYVLITVPFLGGVHEEPNDFQRFTKYGLIELFKYFGEILEIKEQGYLFCVISMLVNECLNNFASKNKFCYAFSTFCYFPFFLIQYVSYFLDKMFKTKNITYNYLVLCRKT